MRFIIHRALLCLCLVSYSGFAQEEPEEKPPIPEAKTSVTSHSIKINGKKLSYTATAGTMLMKNAKQEPIALFGYTAYVKEDTSLRKRPRRRRSRGPRCRPPCSGAERVSGVGAMVSVGFSAAPVVNTDPSETKRLAMSWV